MSEQHDEYAARDGRADHRADERDNSAFHGEHRQNLSARSAQHGEFGGVCALVFRAEQEDERDGDDGQRDDSDARNADGSGNAVGAGLYIARIRGNRNCEVGVIFEGGNVGDERGSVHALGRLDINFVVHDHAAEQSVRAAVDVADDGERRVGEEISVVLGNRRHEENLAAEHQSLSPAHAESLGRDAGNDDAVGVARARQVGDASFREIYGVEFLPVALFESAQFDILLARGRARQRVKGKRGHGEFHPVAERGQRLDGSQAVAAALARDENVGISGVGGLHRIDVVVHRVAEGKHAEKHCHRNRDDKHGAHRAEGLGPQVFERERECHFSRRVRRGRNRKLSCRPRFRLCGKRTRSAPSNALP